MAVIAGSAGPEKKRPAVSMKKLTTGNSTSKARDVAPSAGKVETSTPARPPRSTTPASLESASVGTRPSNPGKAGTLVSVQASVSTSLLGGGAQAAESREQPEFQIEVPIKSSEPLEHDHQEFEVPVDGENSGIRAQETRSEQLIAEQEAGVQHALETGEPVTFVNAQGNSEQISVTRAEDGSYTIRAEDGHRLKVNLDLDEAEDLTALTNITNYYSEVPDHLRESVETINVQSEPAEHGAAFYSPGERSLTFGSGLRFLDEHTFNHEFGHGIAFHVADQQDGSVENFLEIFVGELNQGVPDGYIEAAQADAGQVTDYAGTDPRENFAETWLFYVDARQRGEEALQAFAEVYPNQTEFLNQIYDGTYKSDDLAG